MNNKLNNQNFNSALFLSYIITEGFDPNNYANILELFQSANASMSQFLTPYNQYLLSRQVNYDELDKLNIDGAYGYLDENGILVPKTIYNDARFLQSRENSMYKRHGYGCPTIENFDVIIGNGNSQYTRHAAHLPQDQYLGFCMDKDSANLENSLKLYEHLVELINSYRREEYILARESISSGNKELCLLKRK